MKKKLVVFSAMLVCLLALVLTGCATNLGPNWENKWFVHVVEPGEHDYTILGPVAVEKTWMGILGSRMETAFGSFGWFLYERGGVNYIDVLNDAKRQYPSANAVVDINISSVESKYGPFFSTRDLIVTGLAVRFADEQKNGRHWRGDRD